LPLLKFQPSYIYCRIPSLPFLNEIFMCISHLLNACCVSCPSDCHWFRRSCDRGTLFYVAIIAVDPFIAVT